MERRPGRQREGSAQAFLWVGEGTPGQELGQHVPAWHGCLEAVPRFLGPVLSKGNGSESLLLEHGRGAQIRWTLGAWRGFVGREVVGVPAGNGRECSQGWGLPGHLGILFRSGFLGTLGLDSGVFVVLFAYNFSI